MRLLFPKRKKRRAKASIPLEPLEARALLSAAISITANNHLLFSGETNPSTLDFTDFGYMATTPVETIGELTRTFTITNTGDQPLNFTGIGNKLEIEGDTDEFFIHTDIASPLAAGSSETFTITFAPQAAQVYHAQVSLASDDPNTPLFQFDIQGTGLAMTTQGDGLQIATLTSGSGNTAVTGSALSVDYTGDLMDGTQFDASAAGSPLNFVLGRGDVIAGWEEGLLGIQPGETRVLIIPGALAYPGGNTNGSVVIPPDAPLFFTVTAESVTQPDISVSGNGTPIDNGESSPSSTDLTDFGQAPITTSTNGTITRTFTISNTSSADLTITGVPTISGADPNDFTVTTPPPTTIPAGSTTSTFTITFSPQDIGLRLATVTIPSTAPDQPNFSFDIQGSGLTTVNSTTGLMIATTTTGSGLQAVEGSDVTLNFTGTLFDGTVFASVIDPNSPGDVVIGHPGVIDGLSEGLMGIQPGETRTLFIPASLAYGSAGFGDIPPNAPVIYTISVISVTAPSINMDVTGNNTTIADGDTTPSLVDATDFGYVSTTPALNASIGTITRTFSINDDGGLDLALTGNPNLVTITGANAADFVVTSAPGSAITQGTFSNFTITFTPHGNGLRTATVTIPSDDPNHPAYTFSIQGTGLATTNATNGLMVATTVAGSGKAAYLGAGLTVNYTGFLTDGTIFDSSDPAINAGRTPFAFPLGAGQVISGWDQGLVGLKPGETRVLIIPSALAYGVAGNSNGSITIAPNTPLIFTVTGVSVTDPKITILGNNTIVQGSSFVTIANGDTTPSTGDFTDFRDASYTPDSSSASTPATRTFIVTNATTAGDIYYTGTPVTISGPNAGDFKVISQPISGAANGQAAPFTIEFDPHGAGKRTAIVTVHSTDPATPAYTFTIQGTGIKTANSTADHLESATLVQGTTTIVHSQDYVVLDYTGWLSDGTVWDSSVFDSSYQPGHQPLQLQITDSTSGVISNTILGTATDGSNTLVPSGTIIDGIAEGVQGIKAGETRLLIVPAGVGFGDAGSTYVPPDATLYITVTAEQRSLVVYTIVDDNGTPTGTLVPAGETAPTSANLTFIGTIPAGSSPTPISQNYILQAGGNFTGINLTSPIVNITGSGAAAFKSTFLSSSGTIGEFTTITFSPPRPGTYTTVAHVHSNDPVTPDYQFTISATETPWVDLTPTIGTISFPASGSLTSGAATSYNIPLSITNNGNAAVSSTASGSDFQVSLHNTNSTSSANDIVISNATSTALRNLASHATKNLTLSTPIPITVPAGDYQVVVTFNTNGAIPEFNGTNNTVTSSRVIHVTQGANNLTAALGTISLPAGPIIAGSTATFNLPLTVTNNGTVAVNAASPPITFNIYVQNGTAQTLIGSQTSTSLRSLAVGKSAKLTLSTQLPITLPAGTYQFVVKANENAAISETTFADDNPISSQTFSTSTGFNNLSAAVGTIALPKGVTVTGSSTAFKIPVVVTNNGNVTVNAASPPITFDIYMHDTNANTDTLIATQTSNGLRGLAVGKSANLSLSTTLPGALPNGNYEFLVKVNENSAITESTLADNQVTSTQSFNASQGFFDLSAAIGTTTFKANTPIFSGDITQYKIPLTITNAGNLPIAANAGAVSIKVYLHNATGGADTLISSATTTSLRGLAVGKSLAMTLSPTIPITVPAGTFQFVVKIDENAGITEATLDNNNPMSNQTFSVAQGVYNITGSLSTSTFVTTVAHGTTFSGKLTATIVNASNITFPSNQTVNVQLVARQTDGSIIPIGPASNVSLGSFVPGKATTVSLSKTLTGGLDAGTYTLEVQLTLAPNITQDTSDDLLSKTPANATFPLTVT